MPVFEIELDDGRKLRVDADDQQAALAGVAQFTASQPSKEATAESAPGMGDAFRQGTANVLGGVGETVEQFTGKGGVSDTLKSKAAAIRPENYDPAKLYSDKDGVQLSNAPRAFVENSPQLAAAIAAYKAGSKVGGWKGGMLGAGAASLGLNLGNLTKKSADERTGVTDTPPELQDKARAVATGVPSAALDAVGARFFGGASGPVGAGVRGVVNAGTQAATKTAVEAGTELAQTGVEQFGTTVGTKGGARFDSEELINSGLTGGVVGAGFSAPKALKQANTAIKNREFGGANNDASVSLANRLSAAAGPDLGNTASMAEAVKNVSSDLHGEFNTAVADARANGLAPDAALDNAITRSSKGQRLNEVDQAAITNAPAEVQELAQQITRLNRLKLQNKGSPDDFKGGLSTGLEKGVRAIANPIGYGVGAGATVMGLTGHGAVLGTTALPALGAMAGTYGAARALDHLTGARNPVKRFTEQFADGNVPTRALPADTPPEAPIATVDDGPLPTGPWNMPPAPQVGAFGKGPRTPEPVPQEPAPRGPWNMPPAPQVGAFGKGARPPEPSAPAPVDIPAFLPNRQDIPAFLPSRTLEKLAAPTPPLVPADDGADIPAFLPKREAAPGAFPKPLAPTLAKITKANGKVKVKEAPVDYTPGPRHIAEEALPSAVAAEFGLDKTPAVKAANAKAKYETKVKFNYPTVPGDEAFSYHDKSDMDPADGASAIADKWEADGRPFWKGRDNFVASIAGTLAKKNTLVPSLEAALPKASAAKLRSQLWAVASLEEAIAYRAHLLNQAKSKKAKALVESTLSDEALAGIWKKARKKK